MFQDVRSRSPSTGVNELSRFVLAERFTHLHRSFLDSSECLGDRLIGRFLSGIHEEGTHRATPCFLAEEEVPLATVAAGSNGSYVLGSWSIAAVCIPLSCR